MPTSWEAYLETAAESRDEEMMLAPDEPKNPGEWRQVDPLTREAAGRQEWEGFEDWLGWTYLSWRRLTRRHRYQARIERALLSTAKAQAESFSTRIGRVFNIAVGDPWSPYAGWKYLWDPDPDRIFGPLSVLLYSDVPRPTEFGYVRESEIRSATGIKEGSTDYGGFPIIALPKITLTRLRSVSATPTVTSGPNIGNQVTLHVGKELYGQSAAGILQSGSAAMFVERAGHSNPCVLGAQHVFGAAGSVVVDAASNHIGSVSLSDGILDASVVDLKPPWVVDYRLPGLNIIPGMPLMPFVNMPVQMFGAKSGHRTGYVSHTNFTAPSQPGASIANNILTTILAQKGDSGALLCSGYYAQPAIFGPYLSSKSQQYRDTYTCAAIGILEGQANQGVGPAAGLPTIFRLVDDILASMNLDPLVR